MADGSFRKAVDLLARRPHFEGEIRQKLLQRGFDGAEVEATVGRLLGLGYLDDDACARDFVRAKLRRSPMGRRKLSFELRRRGAEKGSIERALADPELETDIDLARRAGQRWTATGRCDREALMRHLDRRGFSKSDILRVAEEQLPRDSSS